MGMCAASAERCSCSCQVARSSPPPRTCCHACTGVVGHGAQCSAGATCSSRAALSELYPWSVIDSNTISMLSMLFQQSQLLKNKLQEDASTNSVEFLQRVLHHGLHGLAT